MPAAIDAADGGIDGKSGEVPPTGAGTGRRALAPRLATGCARSCSTRSSAVSIARHSRVASGPVRASPHAVHTASGETCPRQSGHTVGSLSLLMRRW